jgi:ribosomal protein L2
MFFGGDPFDHFHGGGGGRQRGGGSSGRASSGGRGGGASVDTTKLYETLGVRRRGQKRIKTLIKCAFFL